MAKGVPGTFFPHYYSVFSLFSAISPSFGEQMTGVEIQSEIWNKNEQLSMLVSVITDNQTSILEKYIVLHLLERALDSTTLN